MKTLRLLSQEHREKTYTVYLYNQEDLINYLQQNETKNGDIMTGLTEDEITPHHLMLYASFYQKENIRVVEEIKTDVFFTYKDEGGEPIGAHPEGIHNCK